MSKRPAIICAVVLLFASGACLGQVEMVPKKQTAFGVRVGFGLADQYSSVGGGADLVILGRAGLHVHYSSVSFDGGGNVQVYTYYVSGALVKPEARSGNIGVQLLAGGRNERTVGKSIGGYLMFGGGIYWDVYLGRSASIYPQISYVYHQDTRMYGGTDNGAWELTLPFFFGGCHGGFHIAAGIVRGVETDATTYGISLGYLFTQCLP